mmetsp:Transcript_27204/g.64733  ORF Transcript_27204/g.64733 Transcript_27204/m.64733 type:complete len:242 (+) Transcript_27204:1413-2138(+)
MVSHSPRRIPDFTTQLTVDDAHDDAIDRHERPTSIAARCQVGHDHIQVEPHRQDVDKNEHLQHLSHCFPLVARDGFISDSQILPADIRRFGIHLGNLNLLLLIGEEGLFGLIGFHDGILARGLGHDQESLAGALELLFPIKPFLGLAPIFGHIVLQVPQAFLRECHFLSIRRLTLQHELDLCCTAKPVEHVIDLPFQRLIASEVVADAYALDLEVDPALCELCFCPLLQSHLVCQVRRKAL